MFMREVVLSLHRKMFDLDEKVLIPKYFDFLSLYKVVTLVFIVAPYIALKSWPPRPLSKKSLVLIYHQA